MDKRVSIDLSQYDDDAGIGCLYGCLAFVLALVMIFVFGMCTCGCSPRIIERVETKTDTVQINRTTHDSIYVHDSINVKEYMRQDTFFIERVKWRTVWREKIKFDSIYIAKNDTIVQTRCEEVAKPLSRWQRSMITLGAFTLLVFIGWIMWKGHKAYKSLCLLFLTFFFLIS